jgi:hypothetical protein
MKKAMKTAKTRETKKNWPRIDQKAKKQFSKIRGYIIYLRKDIRNKK